VFEVLEYIKWRTKANGRAGVHSPFLFHLCDKVFPHRFKHEEVKAIKKFRQRLLTDRSTIDITDFGAGSKTGKSNLRTVSGIIKNTSKSHAWGTVLHALARERKPETIIELGTSLGISGLYLSTAMSEGKLITLEGCPNTAQKARQHIDAFGMDNVEIRTGNFDDTLPVLLKEIPFVEFAYIDGNHTEEATLRYFEWLKAKSDSRTLLIFDDIHWSPGMKNAWYHIIRDPKTTLTVDLFRLGLVFFDTRLSKQHFNILL
jgi:predicted O-methyltransferase YrrM